MTNQRITPNRYDGVADLFAQRAEDGAYNAYLDRPAMQGMLPPLAGLRVLDAGCGPGIYAAWMLEQGAEVVGLDISERMVELARERHGERAVFHVADLEQPLSMLSDASFDLVLSALAMDYVRDWHALFAEFRRVLRPDGRLVFSVVHPADDFYRLHPENNYFAVEAVTITFKWPDLGVAVDMPYYRRPLAAMFDPLLANGFVLEQLVEPQPTPGFAERDLRHYNLIMRRPTFICIGAVAPGV